MNNSTRIEVFQTMAMLYELVYDPEFQDYLNQLLYQNMGRGSGSSYGFAEIDYIHDNMKNMTQLSSRFTFPQRMQFGIFYLSVFNQYYSHFRDKYRLIITANDFCNELTRRKRQFMDDNYRDLMESVITTFRDLYRDELAEIYESAEGVTRYYFNH
jgi:hypothetical protein